jgi:hypothetical protein
MKPNGVCQLSENFRKAVALTFSIIFYFWEHETIHAHCPFVPGRRTGDFLRDQEANSVG